VLSQRGHEIIGLSRRNGFNIRNITKVLEKMSDSDIFINNAQSGYAQTELLFAVYDAWQGQKQRLIINISTQMTQDPVSCLPGIHMTAYRSQKCTLEQAHWQLRHQGGGPRMILVKPGATATQPGQHVPDYVMPMVWATTLVDILSGLDESVWINEISLGANVGQKILY
jgi:hypothetical protein